MKQLGFLALAAAVCLATPAGAKIKDWKVTPSSTESVILMRADRQPYPWSLWLHREGSGGFGRRVYSLDVKPHETFPYTGRTLAPGSYQVSSIVQQGAWSSCFGNGSVAFTVEPGKVYYLGSLNAMPLLIELQESAIARGKTALTRGALAIGWEPKIKPEFATPGDGELAEVSQFVASSMPKTTAPVVPLTTRPITFGMTGGEKIVQVCG